MRTLALRRLPPLLPSGRGHLPLFLSSFLVAVCFHCCWVWFLSPIPLETVLYVLWGKALPLAKFPITFSMWNSTHTGASWPCWDSPTERLEGPQQDAQAQIVLVIRADRRKALCFEKSLLGIRETLGVFRLASELGRFFKDTLIVYNQAQGITGEFSAVGMQWDAWR